MKRFAPLLVFSLVLALVAVPFAWGAARASSATATNASDRSPGAPVATALSTLTGIAISPLLGTAAYGAYQWARAESDAERAALPWYAHWSFFGPALLVIIVCAAKDSLGAVVPPGLKKPLDVLEVMENKLSGLVAAGAVIPYTMDALSRMLTDSKLMAFAGGGWSGVAMLPATGNGLHWLLDVATVPLGIAVFAVVWMASHAINVLILLSPWGAIDAALKAMRTALLGLIVVTAALNPWLSGLLSVLVIIIAFFVAGWAFRLTVFGTFFSWDFLTGASHRFTPSAAGSALFSGRALAGVPVRTFGRLVARADGSQEFVYRPWLVFKARSVAVSPLGEAVGRGFLFSTVLSEAGSWRFILSPRYRGHEAEFATLFQIRGGVRDAGLRRAWSSLRDLFTGTRSAASVPRPVGAS